VAQLERIAEMGVLLSIAMTVHATNSPLGLDPIPAMADFFRERAEAPLQMLDECLGDGRPFLAGESPTIADCTLASALQFGRYGQVPLDPKFSHLERWDRDYREREAVSDVLVM
jgi:glutathione S-transferase